MKKGGGKKGPVYELYFFPPPEGLFFTRRFCLMKKYLVNFISLGSRFQLLFENSIVRCFI